MTRSDFFSHALRSALKYSLALVGMGVVAKGQHVQGANEPGLKPPGKKGDSFWPWSFRKPLPDQCPLCGVMAKPYVLVVQMCDMTCEPPDWRRIDCENCNNTFKQKASFRNKMEMK